ncbi:MAG TPA: DEAD/DEAH box helicase [Steroidobacteraceae bacterium]|jgi:ATP-dependent RNA helicase RhlE
MSFADLGLDPELSRAVAEKGYTDPTPIQARAIPAILEGRDVLAGAQTGTGKTAAFVLPILHKLAGAEGRLPRALVLTPTRELAAQVAESAASYGKHTSLRTLVVFGGVGINPQIDGLRRGCDVLVATPGRLLDLVEQRVLDLSGVRCVVLDEADRMLDMGFIHAIRRVLKLLPPQRQNLMFSATYSEEIRELASRFLRDPVAIEVAPRNATADRVDQVVYRVAKDQKRHLLAHLIQDSNWHQVLVFTRTKHGANRLAQQLQGRGIPSAAIHGNKSQAARVRALADFKANKVVALVATEVAARGLDIKELPHVVNYELPNVPEDYVHRIGRTARAGGSGAAVSLVAPDEGPLLRDIERLLRKSLPVVALPTFATPAEAPVQHDRGQQQPRDGERRGSPRGGGERHGARRSGGGYRGAPRDGGRNGASRGGAPRSAGDRPHHGNTRGPGSGDRPHGNDARGPGGDRPPNGNEARAPRGDRPQGNDARGPGGNRPHSNDARGPRGDRSRHAGSPSRRDDRSSGQPQGQGTRFTRMGG